MSPFRSAALLCAVSLFVSAPLAAQDVQYETVTRIEMPGALGTMMRIAARMGGGSTSTVETTYIKGRKMRSDSDQTSIIFDLDGRRFIQLDHRQRTYSSMTFEEMAAHARDAGAQARAEGAQRAAGPADAETQVNFRFSVDEAGQRETVAGYAANRYFLTMEAEGEFTPEGSTERERGGTLVVFTDMLTSRDVPAFAAMQAFQDASAREYANASAAMMEGIAAAFADDPRLRVGLDQSVERIRQMDGLPMKTVTSFVVVAPEHQFDRQMAIGGGQAEQQAGRGLRGIAARAAAAARQPEPGAGREQTQSTLVKVTSEVRNVRALALDAGLFEIPAGYRQVGAADLR
jgi:hypothetical protein